MEPKNYFFYFGIKTNDIEKERKMREKGRKKGNKEGRKEIKIPDKY